MSSDTMRPPREGLIRARPSAIEFRDDGDDGRPTLAGHFAVFDEWTEINSTFEGQFMERIAPGAFSKTFSENRDDIKVLFQHGHDSSVGDKPLGSIRELTEDDTGASYEVDLLDTGYVRELLPGLEAGLYGASFRFRVVQEELDNEPERSTANPDGIPERTVKELQCFEFGPVTFPAYASATAGVRSMTDEMLVERFASDPDHMQEMLAFAQNLSTEGDRAAETHSDEDTRTPDGADEDHSNARSRTTTTNSSKAFWSQLRPNKKEWDLS